MSAANDELPHILVLPEDDANRDFARGFQLGLALDVSSRITIARNAKGWAKVRDKFRDNFVHEMRRWPKRRMILLFDFDEESSRREHVASAIPDDLRDRVFLIGVWSRPERLKIPGCRSREAIGRRLAEACLSDDRTFWQHELLQHNLQEVDRMARHLRPILFS